LNLIKQNIAFFLLVFGYVLLGALYLYTHHQGDEILFINALHFAGADYFFKYVTHLGDGLFFGIVILLFLLFVSYYQAILGMLVFVLSTVMVQIPKRYIFENENRPVKYFFGKVKLYLVDGVDVHHFNSFPSGHTGSAFALAMLLTLYSKNKWYSVLYFLVALNVAISRMYLCQHFLRDVYVGAILGVMSALIIYGFAENYFKISNESKLLNALFHKKR
jgi:membrane-associated phospholipid phosphatase